jgi:hypothetical protein
MEIALDHTTISRLVKPHSHNGVLVLNAAPSSRKGCALLGDRFISTWLESYLARLLRCGCKGKLNRMSFLGNLSEENALKSTTLLL